LGKGGGDENFTPVWSAQNFQMLSLRVLVPSWFSCSFKTVTDALLKKPVNKRYIRSEEDLKCNCWQK